MDEDPRLRASGKGGKKPKRKPNEAISGKDIVLNNRRDDFAN